MPRGNEERGAEEWRKEIRFGMLHETSGRHGNFQRSPHQYRYNGNEERGTNNEHERGTSVNFPPNPAPNPAPSREPLPLFGMLHVTSGRTGEFRDSSRNVGKRCIPVHIPAPDPVPIHAEVSCDHCGSSPIQGIRYRCIMCPNYDLCEKCIVEHENNQKKVFTFHDVTHLFIRVASARKDFLTYPIIMNRTPAKHTGLACAICQKEDPEGYLYKCQYCPGVNICESCEAKGLHDPGHPRLKLSLPNAESELAQSRAEVAGLQAQLRALQEKERKKEEKHWNESGNIYATSTNTGKA